MNELKYVAGQGVLQISKVAVALDFKAAAGGWLRYWFALAEHVICSLTGTR